MFQEESQDIEYKESCRHQAQQTTHGRHSQQDCHDIRNSS